MSDEREIDMGPEDERERGDEPVRAPLWPSDADWIRAREKDEELKALIREANDLRRKEKIRLW